MIHSAFCVVVVGVLNYEAYRFYGLAAPAA